MRTPLSVALVAVSLAAAPSACQVVLNLHDPIAVPDDVSLYPADATGEEAMGEAGDAGQEAGPLTGIWYSTSYADIGRYLWQGPQADQGAGTSMLADVDGDGKDDAVFFSQGVWSVSLSNGTTFNPPTTWASSFGAGTDLQFAADVDGDGKADAVVFQSSNGLWSVELSDGQEFVFPTSGNTGWAIGLGTGSLHGLVADVNGDGKADAVSIDSNFDWYVCLSNGSAFQGPPADWVNGHGQGSDAQMLGDVNGDGKADAVVFFSDSGSWYVAISTGTSFYGTINMWIGSFGVGASDVLLHDINGDHYADAIVHDGTVGDWTVAESNGKSAFGTPAPIAEQHGVGSANRLVGSPTPGGTAALVTYSNDGSWRVLPQPYQLPVAYNTWDALEIAYVPITADASKPYDSQDTAVIDAHLALMAGAKIDFVLADETAGLTANGGYAEARAAAFATELAAQRTANPGLPRYAIAVGGVQTTHQPATIEQEATEVLAQFAQDPTLGGDNYFSLDGKPLLVVEASYIDRQAWELYPETKVNADSFTLEWAQPVVTSDSGAPPQSEWGTYFGAAFPNGALPNPNVMVVMPGWDGPDGEVVSRWYGDASDGFYASLGWGPALMTGPRIVMINSFNNYFDGTAVAPTDTSQLPSAARWVDLPGDGGLAPTLFWGLTQKYNGQRKP